MRKTLLTGIVGAIALAFASGTSNAAEMKDISPPSEVGSYGPILFHPTQQGTMWIPTDKGVYKTTNDGGSWFKSSSDTHESDQIALSESNPNILYSIGDKALYRSTNGGSNWQQLYLPTHLKDPAKGASGGVVTSKATGLAIAVSPSNANYIYLSTSGDNAFASNDGGITWPQKMAEYSSGDNIYDIMSAYAYVIKVAPSNPNVLYARTFNGAQRSETRGQLWDYITTVYESINGGLTQGNTTDVIVSSCDEHRAYLHDEKNNLMFTDDGGLSWRLATTFPSAQDRSPGAAF